MSLDWSNTELLHFNLIALMQRHLVHFLLTLFCLVGSKGGEEMSNSKWWCLFTRVWIWKSHYSSECSKCCFLVRVIIVILANTRIWFVTNWNCIVVMLITKSKKSWFQFLKLLLYSVNDRWTVVKFCFNSIGLLRMYLYLQGQRSAYFSFVFCSKLETII